MDNSLALLLALAAPAVARPAAAVDVSFEVVPRVEFVSAAIRAAKKLPALTSYETEAAAALKPFARDPALAALAAEADKDPRANIPAQRLFGARPLDPAVEQLYVKSGFEGFAAAHHHYYDRLVARAQREAAQDLSPAALERYLRTPLSGHHRFVLAPLLPTDYETEFAVQGATVTDWVWIHGDHSGRRRRPGFQYAGFGNSVAHELAHTVINPLAATGTPPAGEPPKGCNDNGGPSWSACEAEHVVYAVTLRALARERGEAAAKRQLAELAPRGFPYLPALCERLKEYEADRARYPAFESFYPRLEAAFKESKL